MSTPLDTRLLAIERARSLLADVGCTCGPLVCESRRDRPSTLRDFAIVHAGDCPLWGCGTWPHGGTTPLRGREGWRR